LHPLHHLQHLLILPGVEYTTYFGHAGALFTTSYVDHRLGLPNVTLAAAAAAIHAQGGLLSINHLENYQPDASGEFVNECVGCAWDLGGSLPSSAIDAVEVGIQSWDGTGWLMTPRALEFWDKQHALGHTHIAPIGGSDDHHGGANETTIGPWREGSPIGAPATMVLAANLSHAGIAEGVRLGRTAVKMNNASDPNVDLWAVPAAAAGGSDEGGDGGAAVRVGGTLPAGTRRVTFTATTVSAVVAAATAPIEGQQRRLRRQHGAPPPPAALDGRADAPFTLVLLRNNAREFVVEGVVPPLPPAAAFAYNVTVDAPIAGTDRWRAELRDGATGQLVVLTNHIFVPAAAA